MSENSKRAEHFVPLTVVTGGTGGIGRAICLRLIRDGHYVVCQYGSEEAKAAGLCSDVKGEGGRISTVKADLTSADGLFDLTENVRSLLDDEPSLSLTGLVNNAASLVGPSFSDTTENDFDRYFALNTRAPFFLAQRLSLLMRAGGSIVNVSSVATRFSSSGDIVYAMSKAALEALSFHAAESLAERGIRINTVMPGFTDNGNPVFQNAAARAYMGSYSVLGDVGTPQNVADAVAFLLSDSSSRTTGALLDVSGGSALGRRPASGSIREHLQ